MKITSREGNQTGNQSTSKRPMRMSKAKSQAYDNAAVAGAEFYAAHADPGEEPDMNMTPHNGNEGFKAVNCGPGVVIDRKVGGSSDPTPGGGW